jgi:hypothetical protein
MSRKKLQSYGQLYRQLPAGAPVTLTRPEDDPRTVWLRARPRDLARASVAAGHAGVPVDAAIWLCCDAVRTLDNPGLDDVLAVIEMPRRQHVPDDLRLWFAQLRDGSGWHEPQLPRITMPADLADEITPAIAQAGVQVAADPARLNAVLRAEAAAVSNGGRRLRDVLADAVATFRRNAAA